MDFEESFMNAQDFDGLVQVEQAQEMKEGTTPPTVTNKRGRKPGKKSSDKVDIKAKLERSRQSARECRARKKLRYQYLEELVTDREKAVFSLRQELDKYRLWCLEIDEGRIPEGLPGLLEEFGAVKQESVNILNM
ncbi:REPTOR-binding partner [Daktulosphaira vitifoliae]|uniref:REPTOR-binding partner n=1 Tax=Daktulosphaira vitifoliae TaxID=58002 RepID=UPI0021AA97AD|nr:REPTOR-binding partner [Daktulosphaira vitifoliae]